MAKQQTETEAPMFRKGETVYSVMTGEKLTVVKSNAVKLTNGVNSYTVAPKSGQEYRATEGELQQTSPYAPKVRKSRYDYDNDDSDGFDSEDDRQARKERWEEKHRSVETDSDE